MKVDIVKAGKVATAIVAIIGLFVVVDSRYQTAEAAGQEAEARELGDVDTQIDVSLLEVKYIKNKVVRNSDDEARLQYLQTKIAVLLTRQTQLRK